MPGARGLSRPLRGEKALIAFGVFVGGSRNPPGDLEQMGGPAPPGRGPGPGEKRLLLSAEGGHEGGDGDVRRASMCEAVAELQP